jgi:hypothetical protein
MIKIYINNNIIYEHGINKNSPQFVLLITKKNQLLYTSYVTTDFHKEYDVLYVDIKNDKCKRFIKSVSLFKQKSSEYNLSLNIHCRPFILYIKYNKEIIILDNAYIMNGNDILCPVFLMYYFQIKYPHKTFTLNYHLTVYFNDNTSCEFTNNKYLSIHNNWYTVKTIKTIKTINSPLS